MFLINYYSFKNITLDFTNAGLKKTPVTQIFCDDILFLNAYECIDWKSTDVNRPNEIIQFHICRGCGIPHCEPSGWIKICKVDNFVIFMPAFDVMCESEFNFKEYTPPKFIKEKGIPYIPLALYNEIRNRFPNFPAYEDIVWLSESDAIQIYKHDTLCKILGDFYSSKPMKLNSIIASSGDDLERDKTFIKNTVEQLQQRNNKAKVKPITSSDKILTLFIDNKQIFEWKALVENDRLMLLLSEDFALEIT